MLVGTEELLGMLAVAVVALVNLHQRSPRNRRSGKREASVTVLERSALAKENVNYVLRLLERKVNSSETKTEISVKKLLWVRQQLGHAVKRRCMTRDYLTKHKAWTKALEMKIHTISIPSHYLLAVVQPTQCTGHVKTKMILVMKTTIWRS